MTQPQPLPDPAPRHPLAGWCLLVAATAILVVVIDWLTLPAAFLLGAMAAGMMLAVSGHRLTPDRNVMSIAYGVLGVMIAHTMPPTILAELARDGWLILLLVLGVVAISFAIGWGLARMQVLPGTTAIWGSAPGAASAIILMSERSDADSRLVAFMLYLRVVMVASLASLIARFALGSEVGSQLAIDWFPGLPAADFAVTLALCASGLVVHRVAAIPALSMIAPMLAAIIAHTAGWTDLPLPPWLLALAYLLFGWSVGLRFTRDIFLHALRALPVLVASTATLILICAGMAFAVSRATGMDLLTAFLATSPGGADSIAIIAAAAPVDKPFVLAVQIARFAIVLVAGPVIARRMAQRFDNRVRQGS